MILAMHETNSEKSATADAVDWIALVKKIKTWGQELGFAAIGIAGTDVSAAGARLQQWLESGYHGEMDYMAKHAELRTTPGLLQPAAVSIISARLAYWQQQDCTRILANPQLAYISRYALGRDYHKTMRQRLQISSPIGHRLARKTQLVTHTSGLLAFSRRNISLCATTRRQADRRALRHLPALP